MKEKVEFNESETLKNLARSFASECMEGAKYQFIAQQCLDQKLNFLQMQSTSTESLDLKTA